MDQDATSDVDGSEIQYRLRLGPDNPLWLLVPILTFFGVWYLTTLEGVTWLLWGVFAAGVVALYGLAATVEQRVDTVEA